MTASHVALLASEDLDLIKPRVLLAIAMVILVARLVGELFKRFNQPAVVGEILAGVLLGPSLIGTTASEFLFPLEIRPFLKVIAELGLVIFMFIVGLELDPRLIRGKERMAATISASSVALPFVLGCGLAVAIHAQHSEVDGAPVKLLPFALFIGASMSVTAFPVLARIMSDRGMFRTPLGAVTLACAAVDDILAWSLLAVVLAVVQSTIGGGGNVLADLASTLGLAIAFTTFMFVIVRPQLRRLVAMRRKAGSLTPAVLAIVLIGILVSSWLTEQIGIHTIFGAFIFGAVMPREESDELFADILTNIEKLAVLLLLPVFFIATGLSVDVRGLGLDGLATLVAVLAVACVGKFVGAAAAARAAGLRPRRAAAIGILMNTRGLTELVILSIGRDQGILDTQMFTMMVIMAVFTTVITGPLLSRVYPERLLRQDQAAAQSWENEGVKVLVGATSPSAYRSLAQLARGIIGADRPAAISLARVIEPTEAQDASGGIPSQFAELAAGLGAATETADELERDGIGVAVTTLMNDHAESELVRQASLFEPDLILLGHEDGEWTERFLTKTERPTAIADGTWDDLFARRAGAPDACVRLDLSADSPLAVQVAARLSITSGASLVIVDTSRSGQRRRIASYSERLTGAGVEVRTDLDAPVAVVVRDSSAPAMVRDGSTRTPELWVRGDPDDQGDVFTAWIDRRRRALVGVATAPPITGDPGAPPEDPAPTAEARSEDT